MHVPTRRLTSRGVPVQATELEFTRHALQVMSERRISVDWVEQAVTSPARRSQDPNDRELERFFRPIPERHGRVLRVVVNTRRAPWRVVSAFFDRGARKEEV